jgi:hypothetical protein
MIEEIGRRNTNLIPLSGAGDELFLRRAACLRQPSLRLVLVKHLLVLDLEDLLIF